MALEAAALALAAALGMSTTTELGLSAEVRGADGGPPGNRVWDPVPWEVIPSLGLVVEVDPRLTLAGAASGHLLLLAPEGGGYRVHSVAEYLSGTVATTWRASDRLTLGLRASAAGGRQATSTLAQLSAGGTLPGGAVQPGQPGGPTPTPLDPGAGIRTGRTSSFSGLLGADWRPSRFLTLGGTAGATRTGQAASGDPAAAAPVFPLREILSADAYGGVTPGESDTLLLRTGVVYTRTEGTGRVAILTVTARWEQRHTAATTSSLTAGVASTVHDTTVPARQEALGRVAPALAASVATAAPTGGVGVGASFHVAYAPYVDPFVARVRQRLAAQASVDWQSRSWVRLGASVSGAQSFGGSLAGPGTAGGEVGATVGRNQWETGLALRAAYQEGEGTAPTVWQYGLVLRLRLRDRASF